LALFLVPLSLRFAAASPALAASGMIAPGMRERGRLFQTFDLRVIRYNR
jgi:hypothetical protein